MYVNICVSTSSGGCCLGCMDEPFSCYLIVARIDMGSVRLVFWDLGGQEDLQTLWDKVCAATCVHVALCSLS